MWPIKLNLVAGFTRPALFIIVYKARAQVGLGNGQSGREVYAKSRWFIYSEFSRIAVGTTNQRSEPLFTQVFTHYKRLTSSSASLQFPNHWGPLACTYKTPSWVKGHPLAFIYQYIFQKAVLDQMTSERSVLENLFVFVWLCVLFRERGLSF